MLLVTAVSRAGEEGRRLPPADRRVPGEAVRGRPHPRQLLRARGPAHREGDADLPPGRPLAAARSSPKATPTRPRSSPRVISSDSENEGDVHGITGASAALLVSDIPFNGPIAGVRVGRVERQVRRQPHRQAARAVRPRPGDGLQQGRHRDGRGRRAARSPRRTWSTRCSSSARPRCSRSSSCRRRCARELGGKTREPTIALRRADEALRGEGRGSGLRRHQGGLRASHEKHERYDALSDGRRRTSSPSSRSRWATTFTPRSRSRPRPSSRTSSTTTCASITVSGGRIGGRRTTRSATITSEVGVLPARARLGALHPRRDPGAGRRHPRHQR